MGARQIWGNRNVQISDVVGSHIDVTFEEATRLVPLVPAVVRPSERTPSPARLLRARSGVIPFAARFGLRDELVGWCHSPPAFSARVVAGPGGVGKTRLGVELCAQARNLDWLAGLLRPETDQGGVDALATTPTPRLVVIDYAETRVEQLAVLLPLLAAHATPASPVRVLLLVRAALQRHSDELDTLVDDMDVHVLSERPLSKDERSDLFTEAATALAKWVDGASVPDPPAQLADALYGSPLLVVIAAFLALHDPGRLPATRRGLLDELLVHEDRYWRHTAGSTAADPTLRRRVVALATLAGASDEAEAAELLRLVPDLATSDSERRGTLARWARGLYDGPRFWNPLEPDLLGEHLVATTYQDHPDVLAGVLTGRSPESLTQPLDLYVRAATDHPALATAVAPIIAQELPTLCQLAVTQAATESDINLLLGETTVAATLTRTLPRYPADPDTLPTILNDLPQRPNLTLNPLSAALETQAVAHHRTLVECDPTAHLPLLATSLNNLSTWLGDLGRHEEALAAVEEAVAHYRPLADLDPTTYLLDLTMSLNNLSNRLGALGRREESLAAVEEAVDIRRGLAEANPAIYRPDLAVSLNNLSGRLSELGRHEEALASVGEAVANYRTLAEIDPAGHLPELALSLNNLSIDLGHAGRYEDGLAASQESVKIRRGLAGANPAAYLPGLGSSLHNLSNRMGELGRREEALAAIEEAVDIRRGLAEAKPAAYLPDLATSLNVLSTHLGELGWSEEALAAIEEAVVHNRTLVDTNSAAHLPSLATSLNNLSVDLRQLGRSEEALVAIEETVEIQRGLAEANPGAHLAELAVSLDNLADALEALGRSEDAERVRGEAAEAREAVGSAGRVGAGEAGASERRVRWGWWRRGRRGLGHGGGRP